MGELWHKLSYALLEDIKDLVGIESQVKELKTYLAIEFNNVRIIGVWGMGGIGKINIVGILLKMIHNIFEEKKKKKQKRC